MKWLAPAVVVVLAVLAELTLGRMGHAPDLALFVGRFHPLVVHLPIGFFLLVAAGEAATFHPQLRARVEPALGLLLVVSALAALLAFLMGQLLALEGGFPGEALGWHRRLTLLAVMGMAACWIVYERVRDRPGQGRWVYRGVLGATLGLLSLGAHFGGTLTRGESYLAKYAPGPLQPLLGGAPKEAAKAPVKAAAPGAEPLIYEDVVQPILTERCAECHGAEKQKGKLRLDSLTELMKGGENGAAVVPGVSGKSALIERLLLPIADDDRMPPEGKPGPTPEEIALIAFWIDRGALTTLKVKDALAPVASRALLERIAGGAAKATTPGALGGDAAKGASAAAGGDAAKGASAAASAPAASSAVEPATALPAEKPAVESEAAEPSAGTPAASEPSAPAAPSAGAGSGPAVLATYCSKCHSAQKQKGKLRTDSIAALLKGGTLGPALVPGRPEQSSIVTRPRLPLTHEDHMPPKKEPQPSAAELAVLAAWVRGGAGGQAAGATPSSGESRLGVVGASASAGATDAAEPTAVEPAAEPAAVKPAQEATSGATTVNGAATSPTSVNGAATSPTTVNGGASVTFAGEVQPLLREKCGKCHLRDKPAGGLGVAQLQQLLEGGFTSPAIVPRDRAQSLLLTRVLLPASNDEHMPPEDEPQLTPQEVTLLSSWIDQGAPAAPPESSPPPVPPTAGGCAACSVLGTTRSGWLEAQTWTAWSATLLLAFRRRSASRRRH